MSGLDSPPPDVTVHASLDRVDVELWRRPPMRYGLNFARLIRLLVTILLPGLFSIWLCLRYEMPMLIIVVLLVGSIGRSHVAQELSAMLGRRKAVTVSIRAGRRYETVGTDERIVLISNIWRVRKNEMSIQDLFFNL